MVVGTRTGCGWDGRVLDVGVGHGCDGVLSVEEGCGGLGLCVSRSLKTSMQFGWM